MITKDVSRESRTMELGRSTAPANISTTGRVSTSVWHQSSLTSSSDNGMLGWMCDFVGQSIVSLLMNSNKWTCLS
ncbi:hypothetical protein HU200_059686 [Digitaria exilis]|uniref:Uncharacterized protein n=1 Tax=Digitaria exilis TaxID=1010633 RepID=A0A835AHS8_9POAL|nr:hypothetical protein HU200_059686 [Digitaria exilis]